MADTTAGPGAMKLFGGGLQIRPRPFGTKLCIVNTDTPAWAANDSDPAVSKKPPYPSTRSGRLSEPSAPKR